jgi:hypothetical protein
VERGHTRAKDGSGLGLTISRRLARLMSGDLVAASVPGEGSTFTLWLPDGSAMLKDTARWQAEAPQLAARLLGLGDVGKVLMGEIDHVLETFVSRLRNETIVEGAETLRFGQLADHLGTFIADLAVMLAAVEESRGEVSSVVADSSPIQAFVAERHGFQRARLGWTAAAIEREWCMLRDCLTETVQRHGRSVPDAARQEACFMIDRVTHQAMEISVRAFNRSTSEDKTGTLVRELSSGVVAGV